MFKENLNQIIDNLPLILSDSTDPKDISINRVMITIEFLLIFLLAPVVLAGVFLYNPQMFDKLSGLWTQGLTAFGAHFGLNIFKKAGQSAGQVINQFINQGK